MVFKKKEKREREKKPLIYPKIEQILKHRDNKWYFNLKKKWETKKEMRNYHK